MTCLENLKAYGDSVARRLAHMGVFAEKHPASETNNGICRNGAIGLLPTKEAGLILSLLCAVIAALPYRSKESDIGIVLFHLIFFFLTL